MILAKDLLLNIDRTMIVLAQSPLRDIIFLRNGEETVDGTRPGGNHIVPIKIDQRRFRENVEVVLELLERLNNSGRPVWSPLVIGEGHYVPLSLGLRLKGRASGSNPDVMGVSCEKGEDIQILLLEYLIIRILGICLTQPRLILSVGLEQFDHRRVWVFGDVSRQLLMGNRQSRKVKVRHDGRCVQGFV